MSEHRDESTTTSNVYRDVLDMLNTLQSCIIFLMSMIFYDLQGIYY